MPDWTILIIIGIIFIIMGILSLAVDIMKSGKMNKTQEEQNFPLKDIDERWEGKIKGGGVIMIGPIPIVFGTDKHYAIIAIVLTIVLLLLAMIFLNLIKCC